MFLLTTSNGLKYQPVPTISPYIDPTWTKNELNEAYMREVTYIPKALKFLGGTFHIVCCCLWCSSRLSNKWYQSQTFVKEPIKFKTL